MVGSAQAGAGAHIAHAAAAATSLAGRLMAYSPNSRLNAHRCPPHTGYTMPPTSITYNAGVGQWPVLRRSPSHRVPGYASVIRMAGRFMAASPHHRGQSAREPVRYL